MDAHDEMISALRGDEPASAQSHTSVELGAALKETGFVICEFPPDEDCCEGCGRPHLQHYWRSSDPFSMDGTYYCAQCVMNEYLANKEATNAKLSTSQQRTEKL